MTDHKFKDYIDIWETFDSDIFNFKTTIFGKKRNEFCYAGEWSAYLNLDTGDLKQCYCGLKLDNIYEDLNRPIKFFPIGCNCAQPHCYNGHSFLSFGDIPEMEVPTYDKFRNRLCTDGSEWLQPEMKAFMQSKLIGQNKEYTESEKKKITAKNRRNEKFSKITNKIKQIRRRNKK